jgi:hypothetical protein
MVGHRLVVRQLQLNAIDRRSERLLPQQNRLMLDHKRFAGSPTGAGKAAHCQNREGFGGCSARRDGPGAKRTIAHCGDAHARHHRLNMAETDLILGIDQLAGLLELRALGVTHFEFLILV